MRFYRTGNIFYKMRFARRHVRFRRFSPAPNDDAERDDKYSCGEEENRIPAVRKTQKRQNCHKCPREHDERVECHMRISIQYVVAGLRMGIPDTNINSQQ